MIPVLVKEILSPVGPWLVLVLGFQWAMGARGLKLRGRRGLVVSALAALGVLFVPIQGICVARWIASLNVVFSIPFTGLLAVLIWERASARKLFSACDWSMSWVFGALGVMFYPLALGLGSFDPYEWGWSFSQLFVGIAVLTGLLLAKQNRLGLLLLLAIVAYHLGLLESENYWDYLLDPIYCLVSLIVLGCQLGVRVFRRAPPVQG
jgi:hypothetical protein